MAASEVRMPRPLPFRASAGFTLIELILSIALLAIIMTVAYSCLSALVNSKAALDDGRDADMVANAVLMRFTRELSMASVNPRNMNGMPVNEYLYPPCDPNNSSPTFPGVRLLGEKDTLLSGERGDRISFIASDAGQYLPDGGTHTGLVQIVYRVVEDPDKPKNEDGTYILLREEIPFLTHSSSSNTARWKQACEKLLVFPITNRLSSLGFEYYDKDAGKWSDSWGSPGTSGVPSLVRFQLTLKSEKGVVRTYGTSVPLR